MAIKFLIEIMMMVQPTDYGNGEKGNWTIVDGNLQIIWESGTKIIFSVELWAIKDFQKVEMKVIPLE